MKAAPTTKAASKKAAPTTKAAATTEQKADRSASARSSSTVGGAVRDATSKARTVARKAVAAAGAVAPAAKAIRRRPAKEFAGIRTALMSRQAELRVEYDNQMAELNDLQRDRVGDIAGDDPADTGTKTFEREQEISLANSVMDRMSQVEHALERIEDGTYGYCERCGNPIPKARLEAFPSVTLCVSCKQHEERR